MQAFEYANPTTKEEAVKALALDAGAAAPLSGGTDLLGLMKDDVEMPKRLVNLKSISELKGIRYDGKGLRIGALVTVAELIANKKVTAGVLRAGSGRTRNSQPPDPERRHSGRGSLPKATVLVLPERLRSAGPAEREVDGHGR